MKEERLWGKVDWKKVKEKLGEVVRDLADAHGYNNGLRIDLWINPETGGFDFCWRSYNEEIRYAEGWIWIWTGEPFDLWLDAEIPEDEEEYKDAEETAIDNVLDDIWEGIEEKLKELAEKAEKYECREWWKCKQVVEIV